MSWLRRCRLASGPGDEERRTLEDWVRLRFQLASSDPMSSVACISAGTAPRGAIDGAHDQRTLAGNRVSTDTPAPPPEGDEPPSRGCPFGLPEHTYQGLARAPGARACCGM